MPASRVAEEEGAQLGFGGAFDQGEDLIVGREGGVAAGQDGLAAAEDAALTRRSRRCRLTRGAPRLGLIAR